MTPSIDKLEREIWSICVLECAAQDQEAINRWQTDELSYLKERFFSSVFAIRFKGHL